MNDCRLCGRRFDGPTCPSCGTPAVSAAPWTPPGAAAPAPTPADPPTWTPGAGSPPAAQPFGVPAPGPHGGYGPDPAAAPPPAQAFGVPYGQEQPAPYAGTSYAGTSYADQGYAEPSWADAGYAGQEQHLGQGYGYAAEEYPYPAGGGRPRRPWLPVLIAVLALAVVGVGVLLALKFGLDGATATPAPTTKTVPARTSAATPPAATTPATTTTTTTAATTPVAPPAPQTLTEQQAMSMLTTQASQDKPTYVALHAQGAWLAQLSSKYVGVSDPLQAAPITGGSTYTARDIYAHYLQLKTQWAGARLILIDTRALAAPESAPGGGPKWRVYVAEPTFASQSAADAWCASRLPSLSGEALRNFCQGQRP